MKSNLSDNEEDDAGASDVTEEEIVFVASNMKSNLSDNDFASAIHSRGELSQVADSENCEEIEEASADKSKTLRMIATGSGEEKLTPHKDMHSIVMDSLSVGSAEFDEKLAHSATKCQTSITAVDSRGDLVAVSETDSKIVGCGGDEDSTSGRVNEFDEAMMVEPEVRQPAYPPVILFSQCQTSEEKRERPFLFSWIADFPWPFLFLIPLAFTLLIAYGWSANDSTEHEQNPLWITHDMNYYAGQEYVSQRGNRDLSFSSFSSLAALATSRDGKNVMTASRLEEIRERMETTEDTTIVYKGVTYSWHDLCTANPNPYESPCLRLSPMDLFQEARWMFTPFERRQYYQAVVRNSLVEPVLPRLGIMTTYCTELCTLPLSLRLFTEVGAMEYSDPCRICIENNYETTIKQLHANTSISFRALERMVLQSRDAVEDTEENIQYRDQLKNIATKLSSLTKISRDNVVDFYSYYVERSLYAELGAEWYVQAYTDTYERFLESLSGSCPEFGPLLGITCPPERTNATKDKPPILDQAESTFMSAKAPFEIDIATGRQHLLNHADNMFSSVTTAGAPFPFWSEGDGTGSLFKPNDSTGTLFPVSGSGINMSAPVESLSSYIDHIGRLGKLVDPNSREWQDMVESNPQYAWFMASLTVVAVGTVCGNGNLTGTDSGNEVLDRTSSDFMDRVSSRWCTVYDVPNPEAMIPGVYTKQYFARMWYDLLIASNTFLGVVQGQDDPYSWTTGRGCGYEMSGKRYAYTGETTKDILHNASRLVYGVDEGVLVGAIVRNFLIGGVAPAIGEYDFMHPLKEVAVLQTLYPTLVAADIVKRVRTCNRRGGPVEITLSDAENILQDWKAAMESSWNSGWDNEKDGEVQFVSFFDDGGGAVGSTGRMLNDITPDNNALIAISVIAIALLSAILFFSRDVIESRVLIVTVGIGLVVLSFYAGLGFSLLVDIKINESVAWTLPFVIIGFGVGDVYIVLMAIRKQGGYSKQHWLNAMREVAVPVTMTSLVNASMFGIMSFSDITTISKTSQVACFCIIASYLSAILCFPAYCYIDLKRQEAGRADIVFCCRSLNPPAVEGRTEDFRNKYLYDKFYKPIVLASNTKARSFVHVVIALFSIGLVALGSWGLTERETGLQLEDFFPSDNPAGRWATLHTEALGSWPISINWGALNYTDPNTQMKMIKQFEDIVATSHVADVDSKHIWVAAFAIWTSRHCTHNFDREKFDVLKCGRDQTFEKDSYCMGVWVPNKFGLREKNFLATTDDTCIAGEGGICRPWNQMHIEDLKDIWLDLESAEGQVFCPVIKDWSDEKWKFCLRQWRNITGSSHRFVLEDDQSSASTCSRVNHQDEEITWPIPVSQGPKMFAIELFSHQLTLDMIADVRAICDDDKDLNCWMSGIPFDYWTQYYGNVGVLVSLVALTAMVGFGIFAVALSVKLSFENRLSTGPILIGSLIGAALITITIVLSLVTVVGLSVLAGVKLNGFSNLAFVLSVGFAVEYSVHIVSRWICADASLRTSSDRVDHTMSFLMLPTFMSFVSSTIGVVCLYFTEYEINEVFFFRPLIIAVFVSYWFGCWFLPALIVHIDLYEIMLGKSNTYHTDNREVRAGDLNWGFNDVVSYDEGEHAAEEGTENEEERETITQSNRVKESDGENEIKECALNQALNSQLEILPCETSSASESLQKSVLKYEEFTA